MTANRREASGPLVTEAASQKTNSAEAMQRIRRGVEPAGMIPQAAGPDRQH